MNPLVKALEDLIADIKSKPNDTRYATHIKKAEHALSLYSQSMNTEDHARDYYMNDSQSKEGEDIQQDLKELDASFDYLYKMQYVKDAGHSWIEFTDKWNAFKKKLLSNEGKQVGVEEITELTEALTKARNFNSDLLERYNKSQDELQEIKTTGSFEENDMLRSCLAIIERRGAGTNWEAAEKKLRWVLARHNPYASKQISSGERGEVERLKGLLKESEAILQKMITDTNPEQVMETYNSIPDLLTKMENNV